MGGAKHEHRTARPPRSLPTVGMTGYFFVIFLQSRRRAQSLLRRRSTIRNGRLGEKTY
jgi:hypothetical protein